MTSTMVENPQIHDGHILADYDLHHSDSGPTTSLDATLNEHLKTKSANERHLNWPRDHRRIPSYRAVNTELDQSQRRVYQNRIEQTFIGVMFTGVLLESVSDYTIILFLEI